MKVRSKHRRSAGARQPRVYIDVWLGISDDVVRRFLDVLVVDYGYSPHTCVEYRAILRDLDRWLQRFERCTLVTADDEQVIRYLSGWVRRRDSLRRLSRVLLGMRRFYAFLCDSRARDDNPMLSPSIAWWYEAQRPKTATMQLQRESRQAVVERDRVMLALMIATGLHAAQLLALRMSDLHLEQGYLSVRGRSVRRSVPLGPALIEILERFLRHSRGTLLKGRDSAHVFPSSAGRALTRREFWGAFRRGAVLADGRGSPTRHGGWRSRRDTPELSDHEGV